MLVRREAGFLIVTVTAPTNPTGRSRDATGRLVLGVHGRRQVDEVREKDVDVLVAPALARETTDLPMYVPAALAQLAQHVRGCRGWGRFA